MEGSGVIPELANNVTHTNTMSVTEVCDDTLVNSSVEVCSDTQAKSVLEVYGDTQAKSVLEVCGDTQAVSVLEVYGDTQAKYILEVCGDAQAKSVLEVGGDTQAVSVLEVCGDTQENSVAGQDDIHSMSVLEACVKDENSLELCDALVAATKVILTWLVVTLATLGVILSWIFETSTHHLTPILGRSWTSIRDALRRIWSRHQQNSRFPIRAISRCLRLALVRANHATSQIRIGPTLQNIASHIPDTVLFVLQNVRYVTRWLVTACMFYSGRLLAVRLSCFQKTISALRHATRNVSERSYRAMQLPFILTYVLTHRGYNVLVGRIGRLFPTAFVRLAAVGERLGEYGRRVKTLVHVILVLSGKLISHVGSRIRGSRFLKEKSRFLKEKSRWLFSMVPWRMFHHRCNPQCGFTCIICAVVLFLISYLYISHSTHVGRPFKLGQLEARLQDGALFQGRSGRSHSIPSIKKKIPKPREWGTKAEAQNKSEVEGTVSWSQVSDVINLMAKMSPDDHSAGIPAVQSEVLMRQIKELTEAMLSEKTMLPKLKDPPMCVGDLKEGEVEDILCIPKPNYLSHIKNPCWYTDEMVDEVKFHKLNCLPYFHILGCAKSGTTDLWNRLMSHPHVVSNDGLLHKEGLWWSWRRYGFSGYNHRTVMNFSEYIDLFQDTARQIKASMESDSLLQQILITGDASPPDFWDFRGWTNISQNRNHHSPRVITPHLMKHFYTNPKFILMFRNPIERLYSDYFFVGGGLTSLDFHNDVLASISMVHSCVKQFGLVHCFFDHSLYVKLPVRLPFACYSVFMREWLQVFPLENFLLIKTEEYDEDPEETLKDVMAFLGLGPLRENILQEITEEERSRVTIQRKIAGPMRNSTKEILHYLLDPCGLELAKLLKNDKFTWS